jgi:multidrug resistance efflux pump
MMRTAIILCLLFAIIGCGETPSGVESVPLVRVISVEHGSLENEISADGKVKAAKTASVTSTISGRVVSVGPKPGDRVVEGEPVIWVQDPLTPSKLHRLAAQVDGARAQLESAKLTTSQTAAQKASDVEQAVASVKEAEVAVEKSNTVLKASEAELVRKQDLLTKKAIAETEVEKARLQRDQSKQDLETSKIKLSAQKEKLLRTRQSLSVSVQSTEIDKAAASLVQAQADLESAQVQQSQQVIRAPITGVVVQRSVQVGQDPSVSSVPLLVIDDQSTLKIEAKVDERYATELRIGLQAVGRAAAQSDKEIPLVVDRITPESSGALVNVDFRPTKKLDVVLPTDSYVRVRLTLDNATGALVPISSVLWNRDGAATIVLVKDRKIEIRTVDILEQDTSHALVPATSLPKGTLLVTEGGAGLKDGQEVRVEK